MSSDPWPKIAGIGAGIAAAAAVAQAIISAVQAGGQSSQDSDIQDLQKRLAALEAQLRKQDTPGVSVADTDDLSVELRRIEARASSIAGMHGTAGKKELSETYGSLENTLVKEGLVDARKLPGGKSWFVRYFEQRGAAFLGY